LKSHHRSIQACPLLRLVWISRQSEALTGSPADALLKGVRDEVDESSGGRDDIVVGVLSVGRDLEVECEYGSGSCRLSDLYL
jgi:hypothetical protein